MGVKVAVSKNGYALRFADDIMKKDRKIVLAAVTQSGSSLRDAAEDLKADREIVLAAVSQNGNALEYAAGALKTDEKVVLAAMCSDVRRSIRRGRGEEGEEDLKGPWRQAEKLSRRRAL